MNDLEAIRARRSVRTFEPRPLEGPQREAVLRALEACVRGPFGSAVRFALVEPGGDLAAAPAPWTYGVIRGAHAFVAGAVAPGPVSIFDFGYCGERFVLEATKLGLGTCWLGGTFRASVFAERLGLRGGEVVPCVTPVGVPADRRTLVERAFRAFSGADRRKPWSALFFDAALRPLSAQDAGGFAEALEAVRLGPSASNGQPWRVIRSADGRAFHFGLVRSALVDRAVSPVSLQEVDLGIALCHFEAACRQLGLPGAWRREPAPELPRGSAFVATWA